MSDTAVLDINPEMINELVLRELAKDRQRPAVVETAPARHPGAAPWALGTLLGGAAADTATSLHNFSNGYKEDNPLYNWAGKSGAMPVMLGIDAAAYFGLKKLLGDRHPNILNALVAAGGISHGVGAVNNVRKFNKYGPDTGVPR